MLHVTDLFPTLLKLAGAKLAQPLPLDGRDAWAAIAQGGPSPRSEIVLDVAPMRGALRSGDWKLMVRGRLPAGRLEAVQASLYDLAADPGEKVDLVEREKARSRDLLARLDAYAREAVPPLWREQAGAP
jgi:arylsulfatase A-like enzyme